MLTNVCVGVSLKKLCFLLLIKWFYSNGGVADVLEDEWQTKKSKYMQHVLNKDHILKQVNNMSRHALGK